MGKDWGDETRDRISHVEREGEGQDVTRWDALYCNEGSGWLFGWRERTPSERWKGKDGSHWRSSVSSHRQPSLPVGTSLLVRASFAWSLTVLYSVKRSTVVGNVSQVDGRDQTVCLWDHWQPVAQTAPCSCQCHRQWFPSTDCHLQIVPLQTSAVLSLEIVSCIPSKAYQFSGELHSRSVSFCFSLPLCLALVRSHQFVLQFVRLHHCTVCSGV